MRYCSKNMHYIYNVEYFDGLKLLAIDKAGSEEEQKNRIDAKNELLYDFSFSDVSMFDVLKTMPEYQEFALYTQYPGLLVGTGNPHQISAAGSAKQGFSFDFVTGVPYIPGSTLKGALRAVFPGAKKKYSAEYEKLIRGFLGKEADFDVEKLTEDIFEGKDVFLGAYPVAMDGDGKYLAMDYITSHKEKFKNPNPVSVLKVKPNVNFHFAFLLKDSMIDGSIVTAAEKLELFRQLILLGGIGAKTNVGYGAFGEEKAPEGVKAFESTAVDAAIAETKAQKRNWNPSAGREHNRGSNGANRNYGQNRNAGSSVNGAAGRTATHGDSKTPQSVVPVENRGEAPKCKNAGCNNKVVWDKRANAWFKECYACSQKRRGGK